jgi:FkbM family methyltransferase
MVPKDLKDSDNLMKRSPSSLAQLSYDNVNRLAALSTHPKFVVQVFARAVNKALRPLSLRLGANHTIDTQVYGRSLRMPTEHPLPFILRQCPQYNRPLALTVRALAETSSANSSDLAVIDVGANIGETIAVVEQLNPGTCSYLCIEADQDIAEICKFNHHGNPRVQTEQSFIGEEEGSLVRLEDDGRANPSTKLVNEADAEEASRYNRLVRLDTIARPFAEAHGGLSLIKVDTEGYDFSILRSGAELLSEYKPALYFEWYPALLAELKEEAWDGFDYLEKFGYDHFVFFSSQGDYYCKLSKPDHFLLHSLACAANQNKSLVYFDVFASTDEAVCNKLVELCITPDGQSPSFPVPQKTAASTTQPTP